MTRTRYRMFWLGVAVGLIVGVPLATLAVLPG
jgi:hypothetical protein